MKRKPVQIDLSDWYPTVGAKSDPRPHGYDVVIETTCGPLSVKPTPSETGGAWIACRFENVDAAKSVLAQSGHGGRLNRWSGKWNFTEGLGKGKTEVDYMVAIFKREVEAILPPKGA